MSEEPEVIEAEDVKDLLPERIVGQDPAVVARGEITVDDMVAQRDKIELAMRAVMKEGIHYGVIPGVDKPTLLKPGAEVLNVLFRIAPSYQSEKVFHPDGHLTVISRCRLTHIPTGLLLAEAEGLCTTRESKYAWRNGKRRCPDCGAEAIVRSSKKSAYFCISNEGGCGHRFPFGSDKAGQLDQQEVGKVPNPDLPDSFNTVLKMGNKRALIGACLNATAASDIFTQDMEDRAGVDEEQSERVQGRVNEPVENPGFPVPRSWADVKAAMDPFGDDFWQAFMRFGAQATAFLFPGVTDLGKAQRDVLFQKSAGVALRIREAFDPEVFPPPGVDDLRGAWAAVLDGQLLEGPPAAGSDQEPPQPEGEAPSSPEPSPDVSGAAEDVTEAVQAAFPGAQEVGDDASGKGLLPDGQLLDALGSGE